MTLERIFQIFIPENIEKDILAYPHARNIVGACLLSVVTVPLYVFVYYYLYLYEAIYALLIAEFFMVSALFFLKYLHSLNLANNVFLTAMTLLFCWLIYYLGGIFSATTYWLALPPLLAAFMGGKKAGLIWCGISISLLSIILVLQISAFPFPQANPDTLLFLQYSGIFGLTLVLITMAYFYETGKQIALERLHYLAYHDSLTNIPNQIAYQKRLEEIIFQHRNKMQDMSIINFDIDGFNRINTIFGTKIGDILLQHMVNRAKQYIGHHTMIARINSNNFKIIVQNGYTDKARGIADVLFMALKTPYYINNQEIHITLSMGIAIGNIHSEHNDPMFIDRYAELALAKAKSLGGNNLQYFDEKLAKEHALQINIEKQLPNAISNNELYLSFQPQFETKRPTIIRGMEVLIRWHNKELGEISPALFIPVAERIGIVSQLGEWVMREACKQFMEWHRLDLVNQVNLSVNLSAQQLYDESIINIIENVLQDSQIPPASLILELTETAILTDIEYAMVIMKKINALGIKLVIDDFGSGYTSLNYLDILPIIGIKMDKDFVKNMLAQDMRGTMIQSIIDLAHKMKLKVVVEGVETTAQLTYLDRINCDMVQGYFLSKPLNTEDLQKLLIVTGGNK
jgi:diguanylate cyclase (GGDEF)-like protein